MCCALQTCRVETRACQRAPSTQRRGRRRTHVISRAVCERALTCSRSLPASQGGCGRRSGAVLGSAAQQAGRCAGDRSCPPHCSGNLLHWRCLPAPRSNSGKVCRPSAARRCSARAYAAHSALPTKAHVLQALRAQQLELRSARADVDKLRKEAAVAARSHDEDSCREAREQVCLGASSASVRARAPHTLGAAAPIVRPQLASIWPAYHPLSRGAAAGEPLWRLRRCASLCGFVAVNPWSRARPCKSAKPKGRARKRSRLATVPCRRSFATSPHSCRPLWPRRHS